MRRLLVFSYYFPPLGLGGTQRIAKFVKYLPQYGWQPTVITVKPIAYWAEDESLLADTAAAHVVRTESFDPQRLMAKLGRLRLSVDKESGASRLNRRLLSRLLVPDVKLLWTPHAAAAAAKLLRRSRYDAVLTTSPPHSVHLIGRLIAGRYGLPWVADFRDGWAGSHVVSEPTAAVRRRNERLQRLVVESADAVVACSEGIAASLCPRPDMRDKFRVITNGFDPEDFTAAPVRRREGVFTLCYSGTINPWAPPRPFLKALAWATAQRPSLRDTLRVFFVGLDMTGELAAGMSEFDAAPMIQALGHRPHTEAVGMLASADALLLMAEARPVDTFVPGKTFEYIGSRKPIFVLSNSRWTNDLLRPYGRAVIVEDREPAAIGRRFLEFLDTDWQAVPVNDDFVERFDRRRQTAELAALLEAVSERKVTR